MSTSSEIPYILDAAPQGIVIPAKLSQAWRRERLFFHLRGLSRLTPWLIGLFLFDLLVDWLGDLSGLTRFGLLLANLACLGWLGYRHWLQYLHRFDPTRVSLQVEKLYPGLKNLLVSYVQLNDQGGAHGSPQMIRVVRSQAERAAAHLDFTGIVRFGSLRKLAAIAACVLVLFLASSVFAGEYYAILVARMLNPFTELGYPTRTRLELVTAPVAVKQGEPVPLVAQVSGEIPEEGTLYVRFDGAAWEGFPLTRSQQATFAYRLPKAGQSFAYYFRIGDARRKDGAVKVVPPPRIVKARVTLDYPRYTQRRDDATEPQRLERGLQLPAVPEGTAASWELHCDQPLQKGRLLLGGEQPRSYDLTIDASDPKIARLQLADVADLLTVQQDRLVTASVAYHFEWTERAHGFTFTDATRYVIEVVPDRPPTITLHKPYIPVDDKLLATTRKTLDILFEVSDDYGLGKARLAYRVNSGEERFVGLGKMKTDARSDAFEWQWTVKDWWKTLKEGDVLTCCIEATDNRATKAGPNLNRSQNFTLQIVNDKDYQHYIERQIAQGLERTSGTAQEVLISAKKVKALLPEKAP